MLRASETILGPTPPASAYLESYRVLRSSVMALREREPFTTALVTSARDREGKTTVVINLGTVIGLVGKKTIIVDADFYGDGLSRTLDLPEDIPGLTDLCTGDVSLDEVLVPTEIDALSVLPVGTNPNMGPELAASSRMRDTLSAMAENAEYVFLDCTPMTGFGTAASIAPIVDIVFFVSVARSDAQVVRRCIDDLTSRDCRLGGVIVNDVLPEDSEVHRAFHRYYQE